MIKKQGKAVVGQPTAFPPTRKFKKGDKVRCLSTTLDTRENYYTNINLGEIRTVRGIDSYSWGRYFNGATILCIDCDTGEGFMPEDNFELYIEEKVEPVFSNLTKDQVKVGSKVRYAYKATDDPKHWQGIGEVIIPFKLGDILTVARNPTEYTTKGLPFEEYPNYYPMHFFELVEEVTKPEQPFTLTNNWAVVCTETIKDKVNEWRKQNCDELNSDIIHKGYILYPNYPDGTFYFTGDLNHLTVDLKAQVLTEQEWLDHVYTPWKSTKEYRSTIGEVYRVLSKFNGLEIGNIVVTTQENSTCPWVTSLESYPSNPRLIDISVAGRLRQKSIEYLGMYTPELAEKLLGPKVSSSPVELKSSGIMDFLNTVDSDDNYTMWEGKRINGITKSPPIYNKFTSYRQILDSISIDETISKHPATPEECYPAFISRNKKPTIFGVPSIPRINSNFLTIKNK